MKILLVLLVLNLPMNLLADEDVTHDRPTKRAQDPLTIRALARLEKRMDIHFNRPFPADIDTDVYRKRPLALIPLGDFKVCASRPIVNPFDEFHIVEWTIGPADPAKLSEEGIDCSIELDELGEFSLLNLIVDWATDETGNSSIERRVGESGSDFFERARRTYRLRARKAENPGLANLLLTGFEKIASTIQTLRKEEARAVPGDGAK